MDIIDWIFTFLGKAFAVPELHAVLAGLFAGIAVAYALTLPLPAMMPIKTAKNYARLFVFVTVMTVSLLLDFKPRTAAWAFTVAIMAPLLHEWLFALVYHRWPYLKPKALQTVTELQKGGDL